MLRVHGVWIVLQVTSFVLYVEAADVKNVCGPSEFLCADGTCVQLDLTCDGVRHCADASDERICLNNTFNGLSDDHVIPEHKGRKKRYPQSSTSKRCTLPPFPQNGGYTVDGVRNARPGQTLNNAVLSVSCHPGHQLTGKSSLLCISGVWSDTLPKCMRFCRLDKHASVSYRCLVIGNSFEEGFRECNEFEPPGTVVKPECKAPNYYYTGVLSYMRCSERGWDYVAVCTPECGRITPDGGALVLGGRNAIRGEFPWQVAIYTKTTTPFMQICGGSIVSTTVVLTAAHCFCHKQEQTTLPAAQFAVAAGKMYRPWQNTHGADADAQKSDVTEIKIPLRYQGGAANYQNDIAVVVLATPLVYLTYVRPVCLDFDKQFDRRQLQDGKLGKVAGWGFTTENGQPSQILKVLDMPYVGIEQCYEETPRFFQQYITSDKICAGNLTGMALCRGDSGGGLVFQESDRGIERYYLRGIVSTAPNNDDACNAFALTTFTQITAHKLFIEENIVLHSQNLNRDDSQSPLCLIPPYPKHGAYVISGSDDPYPGQAFSAVQLNVSCDPGFKVDGDQALFCSEGIWSTDVPKCIRYCTLVRDPNIDYQCLYDDLSTVRECNNEEFSGTTIRVTCISPHFSMEDLPPLRCVEGEWDSTPTCLDDCGRITPQPGQGGVSRGEIPWYAAVYAHGADDPLERYRFSCGGSLISSTVVLSVAYCSWLNPKDQKYSVAVGKSRVTLKDPRDVDEQIIPVREIKIPQRFFGLGTRLQYDISVVMLAAAVEFNMVVRPICIDFGIKIDSTRLVEGAIGQVPSWQGSVESGEDGILKHIDVSYIEIPKCIREQVPEFVQYVASDKLCAQVINNGPGLCNSDRGGGLVYSETQGGTLRYYLRGLLSVVPIKGRQTCSRAKAIFTHLFKMQQSILPENLVN